jgi:hypothetical protein
MELEEDSVIEMDLETDYGINEEESIYQAYDRFSESSRKRISDISSLESGFHRTKENRKGGIVKIDFYETKQRQGATLRSAISGAYYQDCKYGSLDEDLFFKVRNVSAKESRVLFYENPEQFERHFKTTLPNKAKEIWKEKWEAQYKRSKLTK